MGGTHGSPPIKLNDFLFHQQKDKLIDTLLLVLLKTKHFSKTLLLLSQTLSKMSYRSSATSSYTTVRGGAPYRKPTSASSSSPVCVHCRNLGLEFDHWLRKSPEPDSPVVCKVLLATECRYCHAFGHTVGSCPAKKRSTMRNAAPLAPLATALPARSKNVYSVFDDNDTSSDSDSESKNNSVGVGVSCKRVDVKSLFASKKPIVEEVPSYAANTKRVDVGTLFSAITYDGKPSPVHLYGVLIRHTDPPAVRLIPRTPTQVVPPCFGVLTIPVSKLDTPAYTKPLDDETDDDSELHEHDYDWTTYGDPEVDRWIAKIRALFASGKSWAEICYDTDSDDDE